MEPTLPPGQLSETRKQISELYGDMFGWRSSDIPILGQTGLRLRTDEALVNGSRMTVASYVRHLLPIWFDVQSFERDGVPQAYRWTFA